MEHIFKGAKNLAAQMRESEPYKEYFSARADVEAEPALAEVLSEYKKQLQKLASAYENGEIDLLPYKQRVSAAYFEAAANKQLFRFLEAERVVVALACDVLDIIAGDDIRV